MKEQINGMWGEFRTSEFGKAAQKSAQTILKAHLAAWGTVRTEMARMAAMAVKQGDKVRERSRERTEEVVGTLSEAATERVAEVEKRWQHGVNRVIHELGLPTSEEVQKLSRKVDRLSKTVQAGKPARRAPRKKTAAKRGARRAA